MARRTNIESKITSKVVGKKIVRIAWKMVKGMINCRATALTTWSHGGKRRGLYFFRILDTFLSSVLYPMSIGIIGEETKKAGLKFNTLSTSTYDSC